MRIWTVIFFALAYSIGTFISYTIEGQYLGSSFTGTIDQALHPAFVSYTNPLTAIGGFFIMLWDWVQVFWAFASWKYSFFTGAWEIFRYAGWALSVGFIVSLVLAVRGTGGS